MKLPNVRFIESRETADCHFLTWPSVRKYRRFSSANACTLLYLRMHTRSPCCYPVLVFVLRVVWLQLLSAQSECLLLLSLSPCPLEQDCAIHGPGSAKYLKKSISSITRPTCSKSATQSSTVPIPVTSTIAVSFPSLSQTRVQNVLQEF